MREPQTTFTPPPRKHHPKGLTILYEDRDILVVDKASGLLTISNDKVRENTAYYLVNTYIRKGNSRSRSQVFIVHRLDRDTSGVIVFAKNEKAKRYLQSGWHEFKKVYYAVVEGSPPEEEGLITSYLAENQAHKMYSVRDPERGKLAKTGYRVLRKAKKCSLLEIDLQTGRKNQIRAHLAEKGCPVVGDKKYGRSNRSARRLSLHAASLCIRHPYTEEQMVFTAKVPACFDSFRESLPRNGVRDL